MTAMKAKTYTVTLSREWTRLVGNRSHKYVAGDIVADVLEHEVRALQSVEGRTDDITENVKQTSTKPTA